jgi:hypothetical protein
MRVIETIAAIGMGVMWGLIFSRSAPAQWHEAAFMSVGVITIACLAYRIGRKDAESPETERESNDRV